LLAGFSPQLPTPADTQSAQSDPKLIAVASLQAIRTQLLRSYCWADHSDMPEATRLRATIRIWIGRDGKFSREPELLLPEREPVNDVPLQTFIGHARRALRMCNSLGWNLPDAYFDLEAPYIDVEFIARLPRSVG
jgi:hypothetical protein